AVQPAAPAVVLHELGQLGEVPAPPQAVAGRAGLADLQHGFAPAENVADTHLAFQKAQAGKIFPKGRRLPGLCGEVLLPVRVVLGWVVMQRALAAAMHAAVGLLVATQAEVVQPELAESRLLVDGADQAWGNFFGFS